PFSYYDLDDDGTSEGLFLKNGVYSAQSRDGKTLWTAERLENPQILAHTDLDGDGKKEFLLYAFPPQIVVLSPADGHARVRLEFDPRATRFMNYNLGKLE